MAGLLSLHTLAAASTDDRSCVHLVQSECSYYHYLCDGIDDRVGVARELNQFPLILCHCAFSFSPLHGRHSAGVGVWLSDLAVAVFLGCQSPTPVYT